ncbi:MAG: ATP-dependent helicase, partial [Lachnospiraceae bacterium]|nr:ATP-dependent helicase [Lachnospiraceae bacterium]
VLRAAEYVDSINGMVKGKCRAFATNIRNMLDETPGKALFRIENPLGYREYLERNSIDQNKLFTLRMLSFNENTIGDYLKRLGYLQGMLKTMKRDFNSNFILSTIHSAKGLEYDRVYLMDVFDGMFPVDFIESGDSYTPQDMKMLEEERRLFYVGMTRAKNDLVIFTFKSEKSSFIKEMRTQTRHRTVYPEQTKSKGVFKKRLIASNKSDDEEMKDPSPAGLTADLPHKKGKKKNTGGKDTYVSWAERFPEHVIVKKEGAFWTTRGKSAEVLNQVLGYKLGGKPGAYMTGSPAIDPIVQGLNENRISFIVVEGGKIIDQSDFE